MIRFDFVTMTGKHCRLLKRLRSTYFFMEAAGPSENWFCLCSMKFSTGQAQCIGNKVSVLLLQILVKMNLPLMLKALFSDVRHFIEHRSSRRFFHTDGCVFLFSYYMISVYGVIEKHMRNMNYSKNTSTHWVRQKKWKWCRRNWFD